MTITMPREHQTADSSHTHLMNRPRWSIPTYVVKQAHENAAKITREGLHEAVRRVIGDVRSKDHGSREEPERGRVGGMREEEEGGGDVRGEGEVREGDDVPPAQMDVESRTQSGGVELSLDTGDQPLVITDDEALSDAESLTQTGLVEHSLTTREQPVVMPDDEDLPDADLPVQSPTLTPPPQVSELRKESQRPRPEDRRSKKMMARAQQVKEGITVNQAMRKVKEKKSRTLSIPAESSRAGAVREAATNTTTTSTPSTAIMPNLPMAEVSTDRYPVRPLPKWYTSINETGFEMKQLGRKKPQDLTALESLKGYITQCQSERGPSALHKLHEALRNEVHKAEIKLSVTKFILKKARILSPDTGLPAIFRKDANFPPDLKADSFQLYNRWYNQDFDQDILRGIITKADKDRNNDSLDPKYRAQHPASAKYYGQGNLVLGQWWPTQLCTMRDGAHGAAQGGKTSLIHSPTHRH
ncbi:hypothetical protein T440DRAFT_471434 [Plenodomus tracheiphilus IPT5]|uniref:Uncharacterized protein n=1 Tax=Plenodomus tracheiphilus IPT5 TaxID=1408161 RepID=A0A6A7AUE3_9PLEO|nr:hypothetical protein T440DRAFT_471434 [Plenodomus tracheiphilus IPT5]